MTHKDELNKQAIEDIEHQIAALNARLDTDECFNKYQLAIKNAEKLRTQDAWLYVGETYDRFIKSLEISNVLIGFA